MNNPNEHKSEDLANDVLEFLKNRLSQTDSKRRGFYDNIDEDVFVNQAQSTKNELGQIRVILK